MTMLFVFVDAMCIPSDDLIMTFASCIYELCNYSGLVGLLKLETHDTISLRKTTILGLQN